MALLTPTTNKKPFTIKLDELTLDKCEKYKKFSGINSLDEVIEKSLNFVMDKDKEFKKKYKSK